MTIRDVVNQGRDPPIVILNKVQFTERIFGMRVEAR
jgi:hypothetical protein